MNLKHTHSQGAGQTEGVECSPKKGKLSAALGPEPQSLYHTPVVTWLVLLRKLCLSVTRTNAPERLGPGQHRQPPRP